MGHTGDFRWINLPLATARKPPFELIEAKQNVLFYMAEPHKFFVQFSVALRPQRP